MRLGLALLLAALALPAWADENDDLNLIPPAAEAAPAPPPATEAKGGRVLLEDALNLSALRGGLVVPLPGRAPARWQNRLSLDARWQWSLGPGLDFTLSDRADLVAGDGLAPGGPRTAANHLREAFLTWEAAPLSYVEAGRINLRNGVALGYNPTDFFRAATLLPQAGADPQALRENRLGTAMVRAQHIAGWGSVSLAFAPRLHDPTPLGSGATAPLDPHLDRTNQTERLLLTVRADLLDLAPAVHVFSENGRTRLGASLSRPVGRQVVVYAEWSGGAQRGLVAEALAYGIRTATLPAGVAALPGAGSGSAFRNDLAVGFSWTSAAKVTVNLEYIFHEAGLSRSDWRRFFALGGTSPGLAGAMWYLRAYAADRQVPASRQQVFLRADWPDGLTRDLDLTALAFVSLDDGSAYTQVSAVWNPDRRWSAGLYLGANLGPPRSDHGSLKQAVSLTAQIRRFF